jgi:pre-mRNA-processing factor 6
VPPVSPPSDIGPAREGPSAEVVAYVSSYSTLFFFLTNIRSEAQARRGEEPDVDPEQFQDPDNEYGLFAGTTYEADDEEADKIYEQVDQTMDSRRRARREAREEAELAKHRAERPKLQQRFAYLKRGLAVVTDAEWESIPDVSNLTRRKRRREERSFAVPDNIIVGDRGKGEFENSLDPRQQVRPTLAL